MSTMSSSPIKQRPAAPRPARSSAPQPAPSVARRDILEFTLGGASHEIDRERGVIHDVKIIGARSRNGGNYPAETLASAMPLYEGARVNIDHPERSRPDAERSFGDWFGVLREVRQAGDGLYGDLSYLKSHPLATQVCEAAERFPESFGLSHNAQVTEVEHEGQAVYETIHQVRSVDIVCKPATTRGIFESESAGAAASDGGQSGAAERHWSMLARRLLDAYIGNERPAHRRQKAIGLFSDLLAAEAALTTPSTTERPAIAEHGAAESSLDRPESVAAPPGPALESSLQSHEAPSAQRSASQRARDTLEGVGLEPEPARIVALASLTRDEDRRELINGWLASALSGQAGSARAVSSKPRCASFALESAAAGGAGSAASNWADPKLAALALLGH